MRTSVSLALLPIILLFFGAAHAQYLVRDINPGAGHASPSGFAVLNGTLFFRANDGAKVMVNVAIMLVAIIAVVSLVNRALGLVPLETPLSLERMLGWIMAPAMWLVGVPRGGWPKPWRARGPSPSTWWSLWIFPASLSWEIRLESMPPGT